MAKLSPLYESARVSIKIGIDDFSANDPERLLSSVRNFYAGLLLLAKFVMVNKVHDVDAELVLAKSFKPSLPQAGRVEIVKQGRQTIDFEDIKKRFDILGLSLDAKAARLLAGLRACPRSSH